jgi:hypothetical protein
MEAKRIQALAKYKPRRNKDGATNKGFTARMAPELGAVLEGRTGRLRKKDLDILPDITQEVFARERLLDICSRGEVRGRRLHKMIRNENDIRALVRADAKGKDRWVEPAIGSTYGLPDCWVAHKGHCVHVELKVGALVHKGVNMPSVKFELRAGQRSEIKAMMRDGLKVGVLVGLINTDVAWFIRPCLGLYRGEVTAEEMLMYSQECEFGSNSSKSFESGLSFLSFNSTEFSGVRSKG